MAQSLEEIEHWVGQRLPEPYRTLLEGQQDDLQVGSLVVLYGRLSLVELNEAKQGAASGGASGDGRRMKRDRPLAPSRQVVLAALQGLPWSQRCRLRVQPEEKGILVERGGMHAFVSPLRNGNVVVGYEPALHEGASEELTPEAATPFLLRVLWRERLCRVERAGPGATGSLAGGADGRDTEERG